MNIFKHDCPHCGTKSVAFTILSKHKVEGRFDLVFDTFATCGSCDRGVVAVLRWSEDQCDLIDMFPKFRDHNAPKHTPSNVANFYIQGMKNIAGNWDAAGSMFRKSLEVGMKEKFPEDGEKSLFERIKLAAKRHDLTPDMAEWAHRIRIDGNKAVHDEEPFSEEEAKSLQTFTQMVFIYLFTLPGMMKEARRGETGAEEA